MKTLILGYGKTGKALTDYILSNGFILNPENSAQRGIAKGAAVNGQLIIYDDNFSDSEVFNLNSSARSNENIKAVFINNKDNEFLAENNISDIGQCLASPGIDKNHKLIAKLRNNNIPVYSEIEFAYNQLMHSRLTSGQPPKILAITGTNGKTTTTSLCKEAVNKAGMDGSIFVGGNIGIPFISGITGFNDFILEISSFQLEWIYNFKPDISVLLNVDDDHLDRYENFDEYRLIKYKLFKNMGYDGVSVLNFGDYNSRIMKGVAGSRSVLFGFDENKCDVYYKDNFINLKFKDISGHDLKISLEKVKDKKRYLIEDMMAAAASLSLFGISQEYIAEAFNNYKPLSHRVEFIGNIGNIEFYDDSKATNPAAVISALKTLNGNEDEKRDIILILGGKDKGFNYESLITPIKNNNVKACVLMGETKNILRETLKGHIELITVDGMNEAVKEAYFFLKNNNFTKKGAVLLSPSSSSFDMFKDYKERGVVFNRCFRTLKEKLN